MSTPNRSSIGRRPWRIRFLAAVFITYGLGALVGGGYDLQQRLFKTGGRLIRHARYFTLQLAESYLTRLLFRQIVARIRAARMAPDVIERTAPV